MLNVSHGQDGYQSQPSALECDAYKGHEVCQTDFYEFFATFFEKYTTNVHAPIILPFSPFIKCIILILPLCNLGPESCRHLALDVRGLCVIVHMAPLSQRESRLLLNPTIA